METLYKRAKTGKIVSYRVFVEDQVSDNNPHPVIVKETGQLTGKKTYHREPVPVGKQKRTALEQAQSQALSDWNKKRDEGYKSLTDLGIVDHSTYVSKDGQDLSLIEMLDVQLPEFNTDSVGDLKPMKAPTDPWRPGKKLVFPKRYEPKLDGNRATLVITGTGANKTAMFKSSGGKVIITLQHLIDIVVKSDIEPGVYDGEVYYHGMTLRQVNKAIKKVREETLKLNFHMFDLPESKEIQDLRSSRVKEITKIIGSDKFPVLDSVTVHNETDINFHHDRFIAMGYEGGMLKDPNGLYQPGQRSSYWLKDKRFDDAEFEVVGYELGQRGVQDLIFVCKHESRTFKVSMNGSIEEKQELFDVIDTLIGKQLTVKYFGFTDLGVPNLGKGKAFREED